MLRDRIREDIISGALPPGVRLKFGSLAKSFGTSTMPVGQALQDLNAEGLVVLHPNRGARVRKVDEYLAESIYDVRKSLMGLMIERCVLFITNSDLLELEEMELRIRESTSVEQIVKASDSFYTRIFSIARNDVALEVLNSMWPLIAALRLHFGLRNQDAVSQYNRALLAALKRRDAVEAVRIAQESCEEAKKDLVSRLPRLFR